MQLIVNLTFGFMKVIQIKMRFYSGISMFQRFWEKIRGDKRFQKIPMMLYSKLIQIN